ncbi:DUF6366 family protein [Alkalihalobacillus deserti]|uniref:DUF6366 family protein n=1 Tax=Alkalihalobacillus deserti TaxID=2879466 RepID=UPI001D1594C3|nr:DUF6366 family protein [Alkalihalobacillus deserti]
MKENKESPERRRERMRQEELKRNPGGNMRDASNRAQYGGLMDLVIGLGWKGTGILILVIIVGSIITSFFFN